MSLLQFGKTVEFEGVSSVSAVFYDDKAGHVISVRGGGVTGVVVKSVQGTGVVTLRLTSDNAGPVVSIKLSPSQATLSVQRHANTVTFLPVSLAQVTDTNPAYDHSNNGQYSQQVQQYIQH